MTPLPDSHSPQSAERLTTKSIVADFLRDFTNLERGIMGTFLQLTVRPRLVVETYLESDRKRFIRPTRYLMFVLSLSAVYVFIVQYWYGVSLTDVIVEQMGPGFERALMDKLEARHAVTALSNEEWRDEIVAIQQSRNSMLSIYRVFFEYYSIFFLLTIPIGAFFNRVFHPSNRFNFAESTVASLYLYSHAALLSLLLLPVCLLISTDAVKFASWVFISFGACVVYLIFAVQATYARRFQELFISWGYWILLLLGLVLTVPAIIAWYIFFTQLSASTMEAAKPMKMIGGVFLALGGMYWVFLFYRTLLTQRAGMKVRARAIAVAVLLAVLLVVRFLMA